MSDAAPAINPEHRMLIDGKLVEAISGKTFDNINPATAEVIGQVADAGVADMELAIAAARRAFDESDWSTNHSFRQKCLKQLQEGLRKVADEVRQQVVAEQGCPLGITYGPQYDHPIDFMDFSINLLDNYEWDKSIGIHNGMTGPCERFVWKEAAGVVAAITPWNFPTQIILAKIVPALAAGCTVVLKPAPDTPWSATAIGKVVAEMTDIPAGVFNVVTSSDPAEVGQMLSYDPRIDLVSFTGSTQTGRNIMKSAADTIKKVFLELGGKSAHIVLDDADFGMGLLTGMAVCFHAGQGCAIPTRFLLPKSRYEEGIEILKSYLGGMNYGDPQSRNDFMSAIVSERQMNRILDYIEIGKKEGARLVLGGERDSNYAGYYIKPTIFADVSNDMTIAQEEIFGPVMCVIPYEDDEDAIRIANDSIYGLSGSIFSGDQERALKMARRIRTGTMNINGASFFAPDSPFGGYKQSGVGREMGVEGFEEYLEIKTVAIPAS